MLWYALYTIATACTIGLGVCGYILWKEDQEFKEAEEWTKDSWED